MAEESTMVYCGVRSDGCIGYFENDALPIGWKLVGMRDIWDVMSAGRLTKKLALEAMNSHWVGQY